MNNEALPPAAAPSQPEADVFKGRCSHGQGGPMRYGPDSDRQNAWREDGTCNFCGGLRPSLALAAIKAGASVVPTDKNYKVYLMIPDPDAGKARIFGSSNSDEKPSGEGWQRWDNERAKAEGWDEKDEAENWMLIAPTPAIKQVKCYTNHFSESQAIEFVTLFEEGKMSVDYPGKFYSGLAFGEYKDAIVKAVEAMRAKKAAQPEPPEPDRPIA